MNLQQILEQLPTHRYDDVPFDSGYDLITPSKKTLPGSIREAQNWEININGGYTTSTGYERFDGRPKPSAATYSRYNYTLTGTLAVGDSLVGATSGATAEIVALATDSGQTYMVITKVVGTFTASEVLRVGGTPQATAAASPAPGSAPTIKLNAQYLNLAADEYRADIAAVPGSGDILGVFMLNDIKYAWRDNAGGTATAIYKSSASGWTAVALGRELSFTSGGVTEIVEGNVITGAISGATATITRVSLQSGTWAAGTAAGRFIFASQTGTFQAENLDVGASLNLATIAGNSSAITLLPDGNYEMVRSNMGGQAGTERIYGCDGVNRGFEFDGTVFVPITTGMTTDTPSHVIVFRNHLFFSFDGSSQHSGIGTPFSWSVVTGASELACGDDITAYTEQPGAAGNATLAIFSRNRIHMLYGTSSADWDLVIYRREIGAYAYTVQEFGMTLMLDDRGVADLQTSQDYGNFKHNTLSRLIQPWVNERKTRVLKSCIARDKSQYRLFFSDLSALYLTTENSKIRGFMPQLLDHKVSAIFSLEANDGTEEIFFGSSNGMVYQMEKGTSFDGDDIETILVTHFIHSGTYQIEKGYSSARFEVSGSGYSEFNFTYELGYASSLIPQPAQVTVVAEFSATNWDSFTWDAFFWDGQVLKPSRADMEGDAENVSLIFRSTSDYFSPMSISGTQLRLVDQMQLI